jgi:hypothetical protein
VYKLGCVLEVYSENEGLTGQNFKPIKIDVNSVLGMLSRLQSSRFLLVWNRYYPKGKNEYPLKGGDGNWSEAPVSYQLYFKMTT